MAKKLIWTVCLILAVLCHVSSGARADIVSDTINIAVLEDDAQIDVGGFDSTNTWYYIARSLAPGDTSGWRFLNLSISQGTTVDSARLKCYGYRTCNCNNCMCRTKIYGDDADNSAMFTSDNTPGDRTFTVAVVTDSTDVSDSPDGRPNWTVLVTGIINEIVQREGFVAENEVSLIFIDNGSEGIGKTNVTWKADTYDSIYTPMRLIVWWTEEAEGGNPSAKKKKTL